MGMLHNDFRSKYWNHDPAEELTGIFEGFVRTKRRVGRQIPGSGLGLAVSRRIARAMGGDLTAASADDSPNSR